VRDKSKRIASPKNLPEKGILIKQVFFNLSGMIIAFILQRRKIIRCFHHPTLDIQFFASYHQLMTDIEFPISLNSSKK